ncbi:MAG: 50S ribosomal protein L7ae-like protein [Firmicutes bacterium]|nr:50S ribosomal protein L7ae-like protein [Bacillota bacterium]
MPDKLMRSARLVGMKQTLRALETASVEAVYIAQDADQAVVRPIIEGCKELGVNVVYVETMAELGRACQIDVGAAVACILK